MNERKKYTASKQEPALLLHIYIVSKKERKKNQTNKQNGMCAQRRLRSVWASARSDLSFRCPHEEILGPYLLTMRTVEDSDQTDLSLRWAQRSF